MKKLLEFDFEFIQDLSPVLNKQGTIREFYPQQGYSKRDITPLNKHGEGSFCRFSINPKWINISGVYALYQDEELLYIGQCLDLGSRFNVGYGNISPRCCYIGGQSTNCKINKVVLNSAKIGKTIKLYFYMTHNYHEVEEKLIKHYKPPLNTMLKNDSTNEVFLSKTKNPKRQDTNTKSTKNPSTEEVRDYIRGLILKAKENKKMELIVQSGEVHKNLNIKSAMPTVCSAMRTLGSSYNYEIIEEPPKGNGSRLIYRYLL